MDAEVGRRRARHRRRVRLRGVRPARQRPVVGLPRHLDGAIPDPDGEHLRRHLDGRGRGGRRRRQPRDDRHHRQHSGQPGWRPAARAAPDPAARQRLRDSRAGPLAGLAERPPGRRAAATQRHRVAGAARPDLPFPHRGGAGEPAGDGGQLRRRVDVRPARHRALPDRVRPGRQRATALPRRPDPRELQRRPPAPAARPVRSRPAVEAAQDQPAARRAGRRRAPARRAPHDEVGAAPNRT